MTGIPPRFVDPMIDRGHQEQFPKIGASTPTLPSQGSSSSQGRQKADHSDSPERPSPPRSSVQAKLLHAAQTQIPSFKDDAMLLARHPERITNKLMKDPQFKQAYIAFIDQLTRLNNGTVKIHDEDALHRANERALENKERHEEEWEQTLYSSALSRLSSVRNPAVNAVAEPADKAVKTLIRAMKKAPKTPLLWIINGNNHFPTHQQLQCILRSVAEAREELQKKHPSREKDVIIISGDAAGRTPFGPGPVVKYTAETGESVGESSEAEAIKSLLAKDPLIRRNFVFDLEKRAKNTRENVDYTNGKLKENDKELGDFITVNSQSGFSGLRSALTLAGWTNTHRIPSRIHLINPDIDPEESVASLSYETTGKIFIQAMREFMNLTADVSRGFCIPPVPIPQEMIDSFNTCLRKIHIHPDMLLAGEAHQLLIDMHETAMRPNEKTLVDPQEGYGAAVRSYSESSKNFRVQQNAVQSMINRRQTWDT